MSFVCYDPDSSERSLRLSLIGGLIGTLTTLVIIGVTFAIFRTFTAYYLVLMGAFSVAYMVVINYVCRFYGTDGALLFDEKGRSAAFKRSARILKAESAMYLGKELSEVFDGCAVHLRDRRARQAVVELQVKKVLPQRVDLRLRIGLPGEQRIHGGEDLEPPHREFAPAV